MDGTASTSAGTAIVSVSTQAPSIHLTLIFTGIFGADDSADVPVTVKLQTSSGKERVVIEEVSKKISCFCMVRVLNRSLQKFDLPAPCFTPGPSLQSIW